MSRIGRFAAASGVVALMNVASASEEGWAAIEKCAALTKDHARHACTDDVMRKAGLLSDQTRKQFGLQPAAPKPDKTEERLDVTLAGVEQAGDGKLVLTTTDGAVWRQVESDAVRPMPAKGETLTIAKTSFGGFLCESARRVAFRCFRAR